MTRSHLAITCRNSVFSTLTRFELLNNLFTYHSIEQVLVLRDKETELVARKQVPRAAVLDLGGECLT